MKMRVCEAQQGDAADMARVLIDSRRSAHRDHIPEESLLAFSYEESERNWSRALQELSESAESQKCIYVALNDAGEMIGVAMGGPERTNHPLYSGEIYILYLLPEYHRQGVGRWLTQVIVGRLVEQGMQSLLIRVLKANTPACRFYEALGGQIVLEEQIEEDGAVLDQVAYGWRDVSGLLPAV